MSKLTSNKISYVNFVLSIFIIWHHAYNVEVYGIDQGAIYWTQKILLTLFETAVPLFFFLSAFLFYYNLTDENILKKLKNRFFSLIIPYFVWNIIGYIYFQIINIIPFAKVNYSGTIEGFSISEMFRQMILGEYNSVTWFLIILAAYTYVFSLIYKLLKNKYIAYVFLILTLCLNSFGIDNLFSSYVCYYYMGVLFGIHYKNIIQMEYNKTFKLIAIIILAITLAVSAYFDVQYINLSGKLCFILTSSSLWIIFDYLRTEKEPVWWMKQNLIFYCGHEFVLEPIEKIFYILIGSSAVAAIVDYVLAPLITLLILILVSKVLKKIPIAYNLLTGFRNSK